MSGTQRFEYNSFDGTGFEDLFGDYLASSMKLRSMGYNDEEILSILEACYDTEIATHSREIGKTLKSLVDSYYNLSKVFGDDPDEAFLTLMKKTHEDK